MLALLPHNSWRFLVYRVETNVLGILTRYNLWLIAVTY
jgi:hypothetical protein